MYCYPPVYPACGPNYGGYGGINWCTIIIVILVLIVLFRCFCGPRVI